MMNDLARFVRAWRSGRYRVTPWLSIGGLLFAVFYVINPLDLIPDYIPLVGVIDDALVLGLLYSAVQRDMKRFLEWERTQRRVDQQSPPEDQKEMYRPKILKGPPLS
jgi:uncharacterized membrane protein YkvA (DUF1232 family)